MKKIIALFLSLAMIACLVACGQKAPAKTPNEPVELLVWTFLNPADESGRGKVLGDAVKMYEDANPNVHVNVESLQWDTMTAKFFAAAQTNEAPDVIWINGMDLGQAIQLGVVEPFENLFLKDWTEEQIADIDDARFQYGTTDGKAARFLCSRAPWKQLLISSLCQRMSIWQLQPICWSIML